MNLIAYSMAVLILLLSCMPCQDGIASLQEPARQTAAADRQPKEAGHHQDNCSPFCHCTCCAASSVVHPLAGFAAISFGENAPFASFVSSKITGIALPVWQPPQLV